MGAQIGSKLPPWGQRVIRNSHIACNRTFHLYFLNAKFQLLGICRSQLYQEETTAFLVHDVGPLLVGLGQ